MNPATKKAFWLFGMALLGGGLALWRMRINPSPFWMFFLFNAAFLFLRGLECLLTDSDPVAAHRVGVSAIVCVLLGCLLTILWAVLALNGHPWLRVGP
jgi:hypothetical protein